jgi:PIN domain nuclease of toxin-antitoxin system
VWYTLRKVAVAMLAPFDRPDAAMAANLPGHHNRPRDRALIAMVVRRNQPIISLDPVFRRYGVRSLW